ncbi:UNVERIFIED_CONTAM: hypothetical protein FKN15_040199 [Acipenser sinensis]
MREARAALFRLRAMHRRLCVELQGEEDLESQIELVLGENEYELCQVEVEQGKFSSLRREVQRDEEESETQRCWEANQRLQKEEAAVRRAELRKQLDRKKQMNFLKEQEVQHRKAVEDTMKNHKKAVRFLKETTSRIHQKETENELRSREEMERRTQAVLSLKTKITATKENIRAMQSRDQAKAAVQKEEERRIRESVRREGGDVTKYMYQQKRLQEFERQKQAFEEQKKSRKVEILSKILQEEAQMEKRKKLLPDLFPKMQKSQDFMPESGKPSDKLLQYLEMMYGEADDESYRPKWRSPSPMSEDDGPISEKVSPGPDLPPGSQDYTEDGDSEEEAEESLAQPEFTGLWDQKHKPYKLAVDSSLIDFGTHVVGETISRTITLSNRGALGTKFNLVTSVSSSAVRLTPEPSPLGQPTPQDSPCADVVSEAKGSTTQDSGESCKEQSEGPDHSTSLSSSEQTPLVPEQQNQDKAVTSDLMSTTGSRAELLESSAQELLETSEIKPGEVNSDHSVKLQIMFTPTIPGEVQMDFDIKFSDPNSQAIPVRVRGVAIDVPVWVSKPNVDLKICMYDRLYQDSIPVHSRANTAVRATFEVCKELRNHMELLPKSGYIQARLSLTEDAGGYFDKETGVLEVPMTIHVADQTRPVLFAVHAVVTASDLEFDRKEVDFGHCSIHESVQASVHLTNKSLLPQEFGFVGIPKTRPVLFAVHAVVTAFDLEFDRKEVDFGHCSIHESVQASVHLTNKSLLPQEFGFVGIPKYVDVQPSDGFGILLPMETVEIDIIFSAIKAKEYSFELTCKSGINRDFKLSCQAVGVHPPLELSHSLVQFGATAVNDKSTATLYVVNSHTSCNEFTHPVPRIGKGEIAPVGPTSFEFVYPEDSDITITPAVGTVLPGKLSSTLLEPNGPFTLMNALRPLQPGATHTLLVSFSPVQGKKFYETLEIRTSNVALCLNLSGIGIYPSVTCSVEGGIIDFGYVLANESATSVFKLQNTSSILVNYSVKQDSVSVKKHKDQQGLPSFLTPSKEPQSLVGTQNNSGLSVFCVSPLEGAINPGMSQDITVTFLPDHESLYYSDRLTVEIVNKAACSENTLAPAVRELKVGCIRSTQPLAKKEVAHVIQLKGSSRTHIMFVDGGDPLDAPVESLADLPAKEDPEGTGDPACLNLDTAYPQRRCYRDLQTNPIRTGIIMNEQQTGAGNGRPQGKGTRFDFILRFLSGDEECEEHNTFILLAILVLVLCGVIVSCIKFCRRKDKPPGQTLTELPCEISVVAMDNQSTVHSTSTVTSFNSVQLPPDRYVPFPFGQVNKGFAPPPYNLYALEMPPPYDEALKMPIDPHENSPGNRKADNRPSQGHAGDSHLQQPPPSSEEELNVLNEQRRPQEHFDEVQLDDPPRYELHDVSSPISEEDEND